MAIAYEGNTNLAFDTGVLRIAGAQYKDIALQLRTMSQDLDHLIANLKDKGWTTPAGTAFYDMTNTNWKQNIEKYAGLLETLNDILIKSADEYENLVRSYLRTTQVRGI